MFNVSVCTAECEEGEWDSEWDEDGESLKSDNMPMYV